VRAADALDVLAQESDLLKAAGMLTEEDIAVARKEREEMHQVGCYLFFVYAILWVC
jgi:hypothetical protein